MSQASLIPEAGLAFFDADGVPTHAASSSVTWQERPPTLAIRKQAPGWVPERADQLRRLLELQENWDSYGAKPIDPRSVEFAVRLVTSLASVEGIEAPTVTASPDGNAAFCWDDGQRSMDIEVLPDGLFEYALLSQLDSSKAEEGSTQSAAQLAVLLTQW